MPKCRYIIGGVMSDITELLIGRLNPILLPGLYGILPELHADNVYKSRNK